MKLNLNGKEAMQMYAKWQLGKAKLSGEELKYVKSRIASFAEWYAEQNKCSIEEAKKQTTILIGMYQADRARGREALSKIAQVEAGLIKSTEYMDLYLQQQNLSFIMWLKDKESCTLEEANEKVNQIIALEVKILREDDPYSVFTWSRPDDEVGSAELGTVMENLTFEDISNDEFEQHQKYWNDIERTADKHVGKHPPEVWNLSARKMEKVLSVLEPFLKLKETNEGKFSKDDKKKFFRWNSLIMDLKFGRSPVLITVHWMRCKNAINELLGNPKRYLIKESEPQSAEDYIDALDRANYNTLDNYPIYR